MLELCDIYAAYLDEPVLKRISLNVHNREIVAVLGPQGAGKTTLLKLISGLVKPIAGTVKLQGEDVTGLSPGEMAQRGAVFLQGSVVSPSKTVVENIASATPARCEASSCDLQKTLFELFPGLQSQAKKPAGLLNEEEKQALAFAMALAQRPVLILIDEPLTGFHPHFLARIRESISSIPGHSHRSIILVERNGRHALAISDRVYILHGGQIVFAGLPGAITKQHDARVSSQHLSSHTESSPASCDAGLTPSPLHEKRARPADLGYEDYKALIRETTKRLEERFGPALLSVALFGSVARSQATPHSDIDLLVVHGKVSFDPVKRFVKLRMEIENSQVYYRIHKLNYKPRLAPIFMSETELWENPLILLDVLDHGIILLDDGTLQLRLGVLHRKLIDLGARKVTLPGGRWYWDLKPDWKVGEIIEL